MRGPLGHLAVQPSDLPDSCGLRWVTRPLALSTSEDAPYFGQLVRFWTGSQDTIATADLDIGLSNMLSGRGTQSAIVILAIQTRTDSAATRLETILRNRWSGQSAYWVHRGGPRLVLTSSHAPPVPVACAEQAWESARRRAAGAA